MQAFVEVLCTLVPTQLPFSIARRQGTYLSAGGGGGEGGRGGGVPTQLPFSIARRQGTYLSPPSLTFLRFVVAL